MTVDRIDLSDLDLFGSGAPWEVFAQLRRSAPVHWNPESAPNSGFWSVTRHADVVAVSRDEGTFSSEVGAVSIEELDADQLAIRRSMLETDGARHWALRRLLQRDFTARSLGRYETFLRGLTAKTIDGALAKGDLDFVTDIASDYPIRVLVRLLGVPDEDAGRLISWGDRMIGNSDPDLTDVMADSAESERYRDLPFRSPAALEVFAYGDELARSRRGGDGQDLVSRLVNRTPEDGIPLSVRDFHNYFLLLVVAGNETTRHTMSHAMNASLEQPDQLALLQARPELMPTAVEEFLRWASPVYHFRRTATRDVDLHGRQIRAGDKVVIWFGSANRDEAVFDSPDRFDVTRTPNDHVAFGKGGPHFCLGSALARLEIRIMFEELLPRIGTIERTGEVQFLRSNAIRGVKRFPVRITTR